MHLKTWIPRPLLLALFLLSVPAGADNLWDDGMQAFKAGSFDAAEQAFRAYADRRPDVAEGYYMLGLALQQQRRAADALVPLARAVELKDSAPYRLTLVQAQLQAGSGTDAQATLAAVDPAAVPAALRSSYGKLLANAVGAAPESKAAARLLERALAVEGLATPQLWHLRGEVAEKQGRREVAFEAFAAAARLAPGDGGLARRAVNIAFSLAREEPSWYERAFGVARDWAASAATQDAFVAAGEARMGAGDYDGAITWFERAPAEDAKVSLYLGQCELARGRAAAAVEHLARAAVSDGVASDEKLQATIARAESRAWHHLEEYAKAAAAARRAGDEAEAVRLEGYAQAEAAWERDKTLCHERLLALETLRRESAGLEGTPDFAALLKDIAAQQAACEPYLKEES